MGVQGILDGLLAETGASRVTLRQDVAGETFPVTHEALAPGVGSIMGVETPNMAGQPVVLARERVVVVDPVPVLDRRRPPEQVHGRHRAADERADLVADGDVLETGRVGHRMITVIVETTSRSPSWLE